MTVEQRHQTGKERHDWDVITASFQSQARWLSGYDEPRQERNGVKNHFSALPRGNYTEEGRLTYSRGGGRCGS